MNPSKDRWDKAKIIFEIGGILITLAALFWGGYKYFNSLKIDKSALLYKDFVIEGIIPLKTEIAKMMRAHFSFESPTGRERYQTIMSNLPKDVGFIKLKQNKTFIDIYTLNKEENKNLKESFIEAIKLMQTRLFFLGNDVTDAIHYSINLVREESPHQPSPVRLFSYNKEGADYQKMHVSLCDAYRYRILVYNNYLFQRQCLTVIANYILKENIHTYKEMSQIHDLVNKDSSDEIVVVLKNLKNLRKLYLAYVNEWRGMPTESSLDQNTEQLVKFFEK